MSETSSDYTIGCHHCGRVIPNYEGGAFVAQDTAHGSPTCPALQDGDGPVGWALWCHACAATLEPCWAYCEAL